ncbi:MAG: secondary thiamine-phosphate synthase enzyme YjbQ [Candidatus Geothermincolales bacterium]
MGHAGVFEVRSSSRTQFLDITSQVEREVRASGIERGLCLVYVPHTTAGVTINENADPAVVDDIVRFLERLVPRSGDYRHAEGNSDAHIKASIMGFSQTVPVIGGRLALGTWQGIFLCEFDGPRRRRVHVMVTESG